MISPPGRAGISSHENMIIVLAARLILRSIASETPFALGRLESLMPNQTGAATVEATKEMILACLRIFYKSCAFEM